MGFLGPTNSPPLQPRKGVIHLSWDELVALLVLLLQAYITIGVILTGIGAILRRRAGAAAVARWWFLRPIGLVLMWLGNMLVRIGNWLYSW